MYNQSTGKAPGSIANMNVGFDILGISFPAVFDTVHLEKCSVQKGIWIRNITGVSGLPYEPYKNTAALPLLKMKEDFGWDFGLAVDIQKGIPLASGLGGSAASAVAAVEAASIWSPEPLGLEQKLHYASLGEALSSDGNIHVDNIAPSLLGGLVIVSSYPKPTFKRLPFPQGIKIIIWHPKIEIKTSESRHNLKDTIPLSLHVQQASQLAFSLISLFRGDFQDWARSLEDYIIEPQRKSHIPFFDHAKRQAMQYGALCFGISGSGPTCFAFCEESISSAIVPVVRDAFQTEVDVWESPMTETGAIRI